MHLFFRASSRKVTLQQTIFGWTETATPINRRVPWPRYRSKTNFQKKNGIAFFFNDDFGIRITVIRKMNDLAPPLYRNTLLAAPVWYHVPVTACLLTQVKLPSSNVRRSFYLSVCLSASLPLCLSVCLYVCLSGFLRPCGHIREFRKLETTAEEFLGKGRRGGGGRSETQRRIVSRPRTTFCCSVEPV